MVLDKLLELTKRSYESNFVGIPTDCPHREKNGWTGDVQLACESGLFLYDSMTDYGHFLDCVADTQRPSGQLPCIAPSGIWGYNWGCGPAWDMVLFVLPYQIYRFYGNDEYIRRHYDDMVRYIEFCRQMERGDGLLYHGLGDWCPVEHFRMTKCEITLTACYYDIVCKMVFFANILGRKDDEKYYLALADKIRSAFNEAFVRENGIVGDDTWAALSCALYCDIVSGDDARLIADRLVGKVRENAHRVDFGILGAKYVPHVLVRYGYADDALKLFTQTEYPGWGNWVKRGATTLWETWSGLHSRNHIMFGDVANWCFEHLGGIRMNGGKVELKPVFVKGLDHFECSYKVPGKGMVKTAWQRKDDGSVEYTVDISGSVEVSCALSGKNELLAADSTKTFVVR